MSELKLPFAIDETQALLSPDIAEKGRPYFCPACGNQVILRKGGIKVSHFAHKTYFCSQETITLKTAKLLVQRVVFEWKSGKALSPLVKRKCNICDSITEQPLPDKVDSAQIEYRLLDNSVADVVLMVGDQPAAAVEIRVTHAVDRVKGSALSIPFIELDGNDVLARPNYWTPLVDKFKPFSCQTCAANLRKFNTMISKIASIGRIILPTSYYRYSFCNCWKCNKLTLVFTWPGKEEEVVPDRQPRPKVVQYRFSKTVQAKYWANACIHCNSIQGDWFLYNEPDGPFFAFECGQDSLDDFQNDLKKLAYYASYMRWI